MPLADTGRAIGAVTKLLQAHLNRDGLTHGYTTVIGSPGKAAGDELINTLNLFLYQVDFDASLRNVTLLPDQPPPLWLSLRYLLTAFDGLSLSDSAEAHELLGRGANALNRLNYLRLDMGLTQEVRDALENNPEPYKITFDEASADLLAKLMQGSEDRYRLSLAFQVRPVMIVPETPPEVALLVGIDYTGTPPEIIGLEGVGLAILSGLGPRLTGIDPVALEPGAAFIVEGEDLHLAGLECLLDGVPLIVDTRAPDRLTLRADAPFTAPDTEGALCAGIALSAGEHALQVRQPLPNNHFRSGNVIGLRLLPEVTGASLTGGTLEIDGRLLGTANDDIRVALYRDGITARVYDTATPAPDQKRLVVNGVLAEPAPGLLTAGDYRVVVLVNGQQARLSPTVSVT